MPITVSGREELTRYNAMRVPAAYSTLGEFWKQRAIEYPALAEAARRVYCISASSAQSKRDFSSVGHTITDVRSRLSAAKVESIELVR